MNAWLLISALAIGQTGHDLTSAADPNFRPKELNGAGVEQKLGTRVPVDAAFKDENGLDVTLNQYLGKRPVVLVLAYYQCHALCPKVLDGMFESLLKGGLTPDDYEVIVASFNATDTPALAAAQRTMYLERFPRPGLAERVHFLTGSPESITALTAAVGFGVGAVDKSGQIAHPGMIAVLTPKGDLARYFFGIRFSPRDVRLGLVEASDGKIGSKVDALMLYCLQYDPTGATYTASVLRILRTAAAATVLAIVVGVCWAWRRERRRLALTLRTDAC